MADPKVWENKDFQYNTITYGFDVRSGIPVDRRFVLTREQMEVLSKPPYSVMMPSNYFCVLRGGAEDEGTTKVYVYNRDQEFVELSEGNVLEFPLKIGKFRLYNEGNPVVIPKDKYNRPETPLPVNEKTGNTELTFASSEGYGLVIINGKMMELDETGMLKPRNFYRTQHLEKTDDLPDSSMFKNPNTIYYLTDDDPDNPDYISGLYAYDGNIYVPIGGRPVDENTMELNEEGKLSVHPKFPLVKGKMDGSEGDRGLFIVPDPSALEIVDEGLSVKLAPGNIIEKTSEGLDLKIDPESLWKDNEGELAVKLDPEGIIHRSSEGLEVHLDNSIFNISDGSLWLKFNDDDVLHRDPEGIRLHYEDYLINSEGELWVQLNNQGLIHRQGTEGAANFGFDVFTEDYLINSEGRLWAKFNNKGIIHRNGTPGAANFGFDVYLDDQSLQNSEVGGLGTLRVKIKNGDVVHRSANGLETWYDPQSMRNSEGRLWVKLDPKGIIVRDNVGLKVITDPESLINSAGELQVKLTPGGVIAKGSGGLYLFLDDVTMLNSEGPNRRGTLRAINIVNNDIEVTDPAGNPIIRGVDAINELNSNRIYSVGPGLRLIPDEDIQGDLNRLVLRPDTEFYQTYPARMPTDGGTGFNGTIDNIFRPSVDGYPIINVTDLYNQRLNVVGQDNREISGGVAAINELNRQIGDLHNWPDAVGNPDFTYTNLKDALVNTWLQQRKNKIVARDAIKLTSEGDSGTKIDVLFDAKLASGAANTTDPTIRLTDAATDGVAVGANRLRAIDFKSDKIKIVDANGRPVTSGVASLNWLNSEIGPVNVGITTSEGNRDKTIKGTINWIDNKINEFILPRIEEISGDPIIISNKNTYWANKSAADNNPLYLTSEHTLQNKYLHIYDYPVKDVKLTYNNADTEAGIGTWSAVDTRKDSTINNNEAIVDLGQEYFKVDSNAAHTVDLKLDKFKTIVSDRFGPDGNGTNGSYGLRTNIYASEGLTYTYNKAGYVDDLHPVSLKVDLDDTKGLLGFKNGKLDIPWISTKPSGADAGKIMSIDSQGNTLWIQNVTYYDELKNLPKIDGVVLRGSSEGGRGMSLDDLHLQRKLVAENTSIVFTSEGNHTKIRANYTGVDGITIQEGSTLDIISGRHTVRTGNLSTNGGAANAFTYTLTLDLVSVDTLSNLVTANVELRLRSNGSYSYSGLNPNVNYVTFAGSGPELGRAGLTNLAANQEIVLLAASYNMPYTTSGTTGTVPYRITFTTNNTYAPQSVGINSTINFTFKQFEGMLVGHSNKYPSSRALTTPGYYRIGVDEYGHVIRSDAPLIGEHAIDITTDGKISALYDSLLNDAKGTIYLENNSEGYANYLAAKNVRLKNFGDRLLTTMIPTEITMRSGSEDNFFADMFTVRDMVISALGSFRGYYEEVADLFARYPIGMSGTSSVIANNDYANVLTTEIDSAGNRWQWLHRYKAICDADTSVSPTIYTLRGWVEEYKIPVSNFTLAELMAMRSGITSTLVNTYNAHLVDYNNPHHVTKQQVGLGRVDNTSDSEKPISRYVMAALNLKQDKLTAGNFVRITTSGTTNTITTTYTGEKDIAISATGAIGHSNTAITATTSEYIYPVKLDAYGHAISVGSGFNPRSKQNTLPGYNQSTGKFADTDKYLHTDANGNLEWAIVQQGDSEDGLPKPYVADTFLYSANTTQAGVQWKSLTINGVSLGENPMAEDLNLQTKLSVSNQLNPDYIYGLATVAKTGSYNDLTNKPTIPTVPTNVSAFTNDAGYLTAHQSLANYATISYVDAHANDTTKHVTATEKATWNNKQDKLTANNGIKITGTTISHTNAITAGTLTGKIDNTSARIATLTYDAQGHLTAVSNNTAYIPFTGGTAGQYWKATGSGAQWQTGINAWPNSSASTNDTTLTQSAALFKHMSTNMATNYVSHRNIYIGALASVTNPVVGDVCLVPVT